MHFNREEREGYRADDYRHRQHHPQQQQQQYQPDPAAAAAAQQQQDYQNAYYRQQQQQQYNAAHQQQAAVDPFAGAFAPFGGMGAPMGFPFGGGLVGGLPGFSGMGGVGMGSFDSMFGNMFAQVREQGRLVCFSGRVTWQRACMDACIACMQSCILRACMHARPCKSAHATNMHGGRSSTHLVQ